MGRALLFLCLLLGFGIPDAHASSKCSGYRNDANDLFNSYCSKGGSATAKPAGANSSFSEAFKLNAATIPTDDSAVGLEVLSTHLWSGAAAGMPTFSLIKGFQRFGAGISTSAGNTFYSNDVVQRTYGPSRVQTLNDPEKAKGAPINLNLGTSFMLAQPDFAPDISLGLSARYNRITSTVGGGPALLFSTRFMSAGVGFSHESISNFIPSVNFVTSSLSLHILSLELELNILAAMNTPTTLTPVKILTATYAIKSFIFIAAMRQLNYRSEGVVNQTHLAVQYLLGQHIALGYLYNYIPGGNTLGLQIFL